MSTLDKPKLRNINIQQITYQGEPVFLLQDGLKLTDAAIVLPQVLGPLALLLDGQHTLPQIKIALEMQYGLRLPQEIIENLVDQFNQALLLENETFYKVRQQALDEYRAADCRPPALAGPSYPADANKLRTVLQTYLDKANGVAPAPANSTGIISPHIDYQRGGETYARVWASAADAVREAELVIIFGTDHNGGLGTITLTPQNYASPLGIMPTDQDLVNRLAAALGPENVFDEELHHRGEHSIELALVWLQHIRGNNPCSILPVLCGSFHHFMTGQADIEEETRYKTFVDMLRKEMTRRRTIVVAAGDLAHLGPVFDTPPLNPQTRQQMQADDATLMNVLCAGDAETFFDFMKSGHYERNVCGLSSFYFTLDILGQSRGQTIAYDCCLADNEETSYVSVCGIVLQPTETE